MKLKLISLVFILLYFFSSPLLYGNGLVDKVHSTLKRNFGENIKITYSKFAIPEKIKFDAERKAGQRFLQKTVHVFEAEINDSTVGYGIVDNVYGKLKPITILVLFDSKGNIVESEILMYREPQGGAVQNKEWLKQFKGKKKKEEIEFGKNIQSISGATISAKSVTKGIKKLSLIFDAIKYGK